MSQLALGVDPWAYIPGIPPNLRINPMMLRLEEVLYHPKTMFRPIILNSDHIVMLSPYIANGVDQTLIALSTGALIFVNMGQDAIVKLIGPLDPNTIIDPEQVKRDFEAYQNGERIWGK
jgi:hypothetical protein